VHYKDWSPHITDATKLITEAEIINGFSFVKLEYLLSCKRMMDGEKHIKDIEIIQKYLNGQKDPGSGFTTLHFLILFSFYIL
jgi:hypothetical protein